MDCPSDTDSRNNRANVSRSKKIGRMDLDKLTKKMPVGNIEVIGTHSEEEISRRVQRSSGTPTCPILYGH